MVFSDDARHDVDNYCLTKDLIYLRKEEVLSDLASEEKTITWKQYKVKCQATTQTIRSEYVKQGLLLQGDIVGTLRHEYRKQSNGNSISPPIVPQERDKIIFLNRVYEIKTCTPATSEDEGIICYDFTASQTDETVEKYC